MSTILRTEGVVGLYRGYLPALLGTIPGVSMYFVSFEMSKSFMDGKFREHTSQMRSHLTNFACGFFAEAVSCVIWVPTDVIKERAQVLNKSNSNFGIMSEIIRKDGFKGLYRGYSATLASFGPFSALYFMFVEQLKSSSKLWLGTDHLNFPHLVAICALSGGSAAFLTAPLDLIKVRLQVANTRVSVLSALRKVWVNDGLRGLFRGGSSRVWFAVPNTALTMAIMESIKTRLT